MSPSLPALRVANTQRRLRAGVVVEERRQAAAAVEAARRLDPHHGGAEVGERPGDQRAGDRPTEVEDLEPRQRAGLRSAAGGGRPSAVAVDGRRGVRPSTAAECSPSVVAAARAGSAASPRGAPRPGAARIRRAQRRGRPRLPEVALRELLDCRPRRRCRDRRHQDPPLERAGQQLGLRLGGGEGVDAGLDPVVLRRRLLRPSRAPRRSRPSPCRAWPRRRSPPRAPTP